MDYRAGHGKLNRERNKLFHRDYISARLPRFFHQRHHGRERFEWFLNDRLFGERREFGRLDRKNKRNDKPAQRARRFFERIRYPLEKQSVFANAVAYNKHFRINLPGQHLRNFNGHNGQLFHPNMQRLLKWSPTAKAVVPTTALLRQGFGGFRLRRGMCGILPNKTNSCSFMAKP